MRNIKAFTRAEFLNRFSIAITLLPYGNTAVFMGKKDKFNRGAETEKVHGNRGQDEGCIHISLFKGLLHRVPARHALGVQLKMFGCGLSFRDKMLEHTQGQMVCNLYVSDVQPRLSRGCFPTVFLLLTAFFYDFFFNTEGLFDDTLKFFFGKRL